MLIKGLGILAKDFYFVLRGVFIERLEAKKSNMPVHIFCDSKLLQQKEIDERARKEAGKPVFLKFCYMRQE